MTYAIVKSTSIGLVFKFNDGGTTSDEWYPRDYVRFCEDQAEMALNDGNYYSGTGSGKWNSKKRFYVSQKWRQLADIVREQLSSGSPVNMELPHYFTMESKKKNNDFLVEKLNQLAYKVEHNQLSLEETIRIYEALGL